MLDYFPVVFFLSVLVVLAVLLWKQVGPGSGRPFGNRVAAHIGMPRKVFHLLLQYGVKGSYLEQLAALQKLNLGLDAASVQLGPSLSRGLDQLEARFGVQEMYDQAKPIVARLVAEHAKAGATGPG